jgi:hypothetical protein
VQKLNVELNYARNALDEAIRHHGDIGMARKRAAWLEDKIESIILSQNEACILLYQLNKNRGKISIFKIFH